MEGWNGGIRGNQMPEEWNIGIMEDWVRQRGKRTAPVSDGLSHYSTIPLFHHSRIFSQDHEE
jgi:hypothetical protein